MKILLSIKPEFVSKIFAGEKRFEFRKQIPKKPFKKVFIYESSPTQNIVGWFLVSRIIKDDPDTIWDECNSKSGIEKRNYYKYCNGNKKIYALEIKKYHKFDVPINPFYLISNFNPPQNFSYLDSSNSLSRLLKDEEPNVKLSC